MNKKSLLSVWGIFFMFCFFINFTSLVSAYSYNGNTGDFLRTGSEQVIDGIVGFAEPFLQVFLGGEDWSGYLLFEKLVLFILIASIVYIAIAKTSFFENNKSVIWVITIAVPLLGIRWMDFEWINYILTQYQILGVALAVILPFIIYLFFVHGVSHSSAFRRIAWAFYIAIYYGLWTTSSTGGYVDDAYIWTILVAVGLIIFDPIIHKLMTKDTDLAPLRASLIQSIAEVDQQLRTLQDATHITDYEKEKSKKYLSKKIAKLRKELSKL